MKGKCPHCKKNIDFIFAEGHATGELDSSEDIDNQDIEWSTFTCPECEEEIVEGATGTGEVWEAVWGKKHKNFPNPDAITDMRWWFGGKL